MIEAVGVVVPARNEEALLPACLASLARAADHPDLRGLRVHPVVVLDSCTDGSALAVREAGLLPLEVALCNVGAARAVGFAEVLRREQPTDALWLATTDADSVVPQDWLARQLGLAAGGADVVVGTVQVEDWTGHTRAVVRRFAAMYAAGGAEHSHVHGANLGLRGSTYDRIGGMARLPLAEDHALVEACVAAGAQVIRTREVSVVTSARRSARAAGGFADLLAGLSAEPTIT